MNKRDAIDKAGAVRLVFDPVGIDVYVPDCRVVETSLGLTQADLLKDRICIPTNFFRFLLSGWVRRIPFNEDAYRRANPDLAEAFAVRRVESLHAHFVGTGWYEGRRPGEYAVDRTWYQTHYKDVGMAMRHGKIQDPAGHYNQTGRLEGRVGSAGQLVIKKEWDDAMRPPRR